MFGYVSKRYYVGKFRRGIRVCVIFKIYRQVSEKLRFGNLPLREENILIQKKEKILEKIPKIK